MDWVRPKLLTLNPLLIVNNQRTIVINFHQDFMTSMHSNFFQGQVNRGLTYWPNNTGKIGYPKKKVCPVKHCNSFGKYK